MASTGMTEGWFAVTSDKPYDRHHYELHYKTGKKIKFDNWEDVQLKWWNTAPGLLSHVVVLDKKKGFS
jgi:hypothetical protein